MAGIAGCLGPSGGDSDDEGDGESDEPPGEVVVDGPMADSVAIDSSARFEEATVDQNLIVSGTVTNDGGENPLSAQLELDVEDFRRDTNQTVEVAPGESADFELTLNSVYAGQFDGYTLTVTAEEA